jgi:hypothetical protein
LRLIQDLESFHLRPDGDTLLLRAKAYYLAGEKDKTKVVFDEYLNKIHNDADTARRKNICELTGLKPEDKA